MSYTYTRGPFAGNDLGCPGAECSCGRRNFGQPATATKPKLVARCYELKLTVPPTYEALEAMVEKWIATCVQSRSPDGSPAHRERKLVRGNPTLRDVWTQIRDAVGEKSTIRADYIWSASRVETIKFSAPVAVYKFKEDVITARPPAKPDTIQRIVTRALEILPDAARHGIKLTSWQVSRIRCWLTKLLNSGTDDRFITGQTILDYKNTNGRMPVTYSNARQWLLPEFQVRAKTIASDREILQSCLRIDELVIQGRHKINQEFHQMESTVHHTVVELHKWMQGRERDPNSIYNCYYLQAKS